MTLSALQRHQMIAQEPTSDDVDRVQDFVEEALKPVLDVPWLDGRLETNIALTGGAADNTVSHKLGRSYRGFWVVKPGTVDGLPYISPTANTTTDQFILVRCTNAQTVDIWFW